MMAGAWIQVCDSPEAMSPSILRFAVRANRSTRLRLLTALLCLGATPFLLAQPSRASAASAAIEGVDTAAIDAYVEAEMRADRVPGVALAIVRGGEIVHLRGYGHDGNGQPVTPQTGFILGSMSKAFTAVVAMQLVEQGKLALDAPVQDYLPWFKVADAEASRRITVRHLLNQTSGLPTNARRARNDPATLADHVRALAEVEPVHAPGEVHEYSSPNYLVLGALIEQAGGRSFAEQVQDGVFTPLGMSGSFTSPPSATPAPLARMARGHRYWFGFPRPVDLAHEADRLPTAALISSAEDLGRFLQALLGSEPGASALLRPSARAEMLRPAAPSAGFSYAMGWRVGEVRGVPAIHHGGIVANFRGKMVMVPEGRWGVAVLTNASSALPLSPTSHRMADNIAALLAGRELPSVGSRFQMVQALLALAIALASLHQLRNALRLGRWRAALPGRTRRAIVWDVGVELGLPILVLVFVPRWIGLPFAELLRSAPDVGYWLLASAALGFGVGLYKLVAVARQPGPVTAA